MKQGKFCLRLLALALASALVGGATSADSLPEAARAVTKLDVQRGRAILDKQKGHSRNLQFERARLAIYLGDCQTAQAILSSPDLAQEPAARSLNQVAVRCTGATAGGKIVQDEERGIWLRLQDAEDEALVPFIAEVADRARLAMVRDLGVELPRPLRIDVVRDLFSLAAVTGLPLKAAETTGTVAVARWGRVTLLSPRAARQGYPWQDTLAHEITHLALTRASGDHAPLWLQEGIAKREETRWRERSVFDKPSQYSDLARVALAEGRSVGIDKLGASIAMLPTPEAATIAFAEVTTFMEYWIEQNSEAGLRLLLADLEGVGDRGADAAMISVTGYPLREWATRWQKHLGAQPLPASHSAPALSPLARRTERQRTREAVRRVRLGDLLFARGHARGAVDQFEGAHERAPKDPGVRARLARSLIAAGDPARAAGLVEKPEQVAAAHAHWLALQARFLEDHAGHGATYGSAVAIDPLSETVACGGRWVPKAESGFQPAPHPSSSAAPAKGAGSAAPASSGREKTVVDAEVSWPADPARRRLCEAARRFGRD